MRRASRRSLVHSPDLTDLGIALTTAAVLFTARIVLEQTWLGYHRRGGAEWDIGQRDIIGLAILALATLWVFVLALLGLVRRRAITSPERLFVGAIVLCCLLWGIPGEEWRLLTARGAGARQVPHDWIVEAAAQGETRLLDFLLSHGADANARTAGGQTALGAAAARGQLRACELLIARGATVDGRTAVTRETPLIEAAAEGRLDVSRLLLAHGADTAARDLAGLSAADWAVQRGDLRMMQLLRSPRQSRGP